MNDMSQMNKITVIQYAMLTEEEQDVYERILSACLHGKLEELRELVELFQTRYGRSMRDVYFKTIHDTHSNIPRPWYERLHYLLSIGCHYVVTPLSILCYPQNTQNTQEQEDNRKEMIEYLLTQNADPNISILIYLPIQKRVRKNEEIMRKPSKTFPFPLKDFSYDFAKVMYYETLLHTISPYTNDIGVVGGIDVDRYTNIQRIWDMLESYGASTCIPDFHGKLPHL